MRSAIFAAILLLVALTTGESLETCEPDGKPYYDLEDAPALFEKFIKDYNKTYKDEADKQVHYEAFVRSLETINRLNSDPNQTATFDINQFADYTEEQWARMRGLRKGK